MPIFDQGYQHWKGPLSGHMWRWATIARHGVRVQRNNRLVRIVLLVAWLPVLGLVGAMVVWGLVERQSESVSAMFSAFHLEGVLEEPSTYRATMWTLAYSFFFKAEIYIIMFLVAIAGPGLISQDLRFNALPLYLARPLTRLDYFLGKLGIIGALVASVAVGPAVFAYIVGVCFCLDLSVVKDTYPVLLASIAYGLIITLSVGTLILALSSLTRRSLYVGITWAGLWLVSASVGGIMTTIHAESVHREIWITERNRWLDEHPPPAGTQFFGAGGWRSPIIRHNPQTGKYQLVGLRPDQEKEGERWYQAWGQAQSQAWQKARAEQGVATRGDWRPIFSYTANLERMADLLLDTDSAWVNIGRSIERTQRATIGRAFGMGRFRRGPGPEALVSNERQYADRWVLSYPWWWSVCVLAGLMGISTWILTRRVKSLDRLK